MIRPASIRLSGCARTFPDGTQALQPIDLDIGSGETLVLLGPSGCGKTTTLRLIAGLETSDAGGRIWFDDQEVTALPIEKRGVGLMFQSYALFPNMDVRGNVGYGLKVKGLPPSEREAQVRRMLQMMRIESLADRRIDQLSGGQRQRVALARALAVQPRVLLLDEPFTALDAKLRETLRVEIDALLRGLGITTIYVTHDQSEAMALGDRIAVMREGRIAQIGTPREIYNTPLDDFVADFVGTLNRLKVHEARPPLLFRPEAARLCALGEPDVIPVVIVSTFFLGDRLRVVVQPETASETVQVDMPSDWPGARGDRVGLSIDASSCLSLS